MNDENVLSGSNEELSVFSTIAAALQSLDPIARERVMKTVQTFFAIEGPVRPSDHRSVAGPGLASSQVASFSEDRSMSPKEFMLAKRPVTDVERVACLAYYLAHYRDTRFFKTVDLSKVNTEAAQIKFSNAAYAVDNATKAGLLVQATKGQKQLSAVGELYVEALPDRDAARSRLMEGRPRRGRSRTPSGSKKRDTGET